MAYGNFSKAAQVVILADDSAVRFKNSDKFGRDSIKRHVQVQTKAFQKAFYAKLLALKVDINE